MREARMVVPPSDLALVGSWLNRGATLERHIKPVVTDMAATARGPIRSMRYFDAKIIASIVTVDTKRQAEDRIVDRVLSGSTASPSAETAAADRFFDNVIKLSGGRK